MRLKSKKIERLRLFGAAPAFLIIVLIAVISGSVKGQGLPQWSPEDRDLLKKGEILAGTSLFVEEAANETQPHSGGSTESPGSFSLTIPVPDSDLDIEVLNFDNASRMTEIPEIYLSDYFTKRPETYLIDPQRLLTNQETIDREGFLKYYAVKKTDLREEKVALVEEASLHPSLPINNI